MKIKLLIALIACSVAVPFTLTARAPSAPKVKIFIVSDETVAASRDVVQVLRQKMIDTHLFEIVGSKTPELVLTVDCTDRSSNAEPYTCMYVGHFAGETFKSLLGAGLLSGKTADEVATSFLSSVAADIAERWNQTIRTNQIESLETCLSLTESNCAVPVGLVPEVKAKTLNLSQYMRMGGLKK
jgi:hypothetical protein